MSAPLSTRLPNKNVYNFTLRCLFFQILALICISFILLTNDSAVNIISNCLLACELTITYFVTSCVSFSVYLPQGNTSITTTTFVKVKNGLKGCGLYIISILVFHCIAVLYGAPFFESVAETFHFAMVMTSTAVLPPLCALGINFSSWIRVFAQNKPELGPESVVQIVTILSILGAWLGAFPIPLDWDRPWQIWPITCVLGSILGHIVGLFCGAIHLMYSYRKLKKFKIT
ncbi:hypothetical protein FSP39_023958 [Pinctada imbricata]|uniref:Phosphatidylinositol-glycan biosynthesis class F protein n=1 Tax=Pinctada imbricata TaxID=66713 RepID=A0AA88Y765_PINIB|nr:hypothetical protein FSP39_023958 [Pinctada imbricata]